jgi:hypothetical protein
LHILHLKIPVHMKPDQKQVPAEGLPNEVGRQEYYHKAMEHLFRFLEGPSLSKLLKEDEWAGQLSPVRDVK